MLFHLDSQKLWVIGRTLAAARRLLKPRTSADKRLFRDSRQHAKHLARQIAQRLRGTKRARPEPPKGKKSLENKAQRLHRQLGGWEVCGIIALRGACFCRRCSQLL